MEASSVKSSGNAKNKYNSHKFPSTSRNNSFNGAQALSPRNNQAGNRTDFPNNMESHEKHKNNTNEIMQKHHPLNGFCNNCKIVTKLRCGRCGDFYCSTKCQQIDWPGHRHICFPMPRLISAEYYRENTLTTNLEHIADKIAELNTSSPMESQARRRNSSAPTPNRPVRRLQHESPPTNNSEVIVSSVVKPNIFYVRSAKDDLNYLNNIQKVSILGETANPLTKKPNTGDTVITTFEGDKLFYRARVLQILSDDKVKVAFVDFGNTDIKKLSDLREMPNELYSMKIHPHRIKLKDVENNINNKFVNNYVKDLENEGTPLRIINITTDCSKSIECELVNTLTNEIVNKKIIEIIRRTIPNNQHNERINQTLLDTLGPAIKPPFKEEVVELEDLSNTGQF